MRWFYNLKISVKLIIGFLLVAAIAGVVGSVAVVSIKQMNEADILMYEDNTLGIEYISNASLQFQRMRFNTARLLLFDDVEQKNETIKK